MRVGVVGHESPTVWALRRKAQAAEPGDEFASKRRDYEMDKQVNRQLRTNLHAIETNFDVIELRRRRQLEFLAALAVMVV